MQLQSLTLSNPLVARNANGWIQPSQASGSLGKTDSFVRHANRALTFGSVAPVANSPLEHTLITQGREALHQWAIRQGHEVALLPEVVPPAGVFEKSLAQGVYQSDKHHIALNPKSLTLMPRSLDEIMAHEGTHAVAGALRTQLKQQHPMQYAKACKDFIVEDTRVGQTAMKTVATVTPAVGDKQLMMMQPFPLLSQQAKDHTAHFLAKAIDEKWYVVENDNVGLSPKGVEEWLKLVSTIEKDLADTVQATPRSPEASKAYDEFIAVNFVTYLKGQLLRYDKLMNQGIITDPKALAKVSQKTMTPQQVQQAIKAVPGYLLAAEAGAMTMMPPHYSFNAGIIPLHYMCGNPEEYLAHTAGYHNHLASLKTKLAKSDISPEAKTTLQAELDKVSHNLEFLKLGKTFQDCVQQVQAMPKNQVAVQERLALMKQLAEAEGRLNQLASQTTDQAKVEGKTLSKKMVDLAKRYFDLSTPDVLYEASPQRDTALTKAKTIATAMTELAPKVTLDNKPFFVYQSIDDYAKALGADVMKSSNTFIEDHYQSSLSSVAAYAKAISKERFMDYKFAF
jgi:hypothetical protein